MTNRELAALLADRVSDDLPCAAEIGFSVPETYNASEILFANLAAGRGDKVAVYSPGGNATYSDLCARAAQFGNALRSFGLTRGDRVVMLLNDTPAYAWAFFGAVRAGYVPVLCNTTSNLELVRFYIEDSSATVVVADGEYANLFDEATFRETPLKTLLLVDPPADAVRSSDLLTLIRDFPSELDAAATHRDEMAFWMYSSGSTGKPKGIVHLQHDMAYTAMSYARHILQIGADDICFSVPKIFFAYGFGNSFTFPFSVGASSVLYPGRPEPAAVIECIERFRPTLFFGLPTLYNSILRHPRIKTADFSSIRLCLSAAEVLAQELFDQWRQRFGLEIVEGLGSTEVLHIYLSNRPDARKVGTAGRRVPGYEIRMTTPEGGPVPRGESGVMWVRGGSNAPCYWNRPDNTSRTMRDGWIWTGDLLVEDQDGFYTFAGRVDDLIKVSGQWVYPLEVELALFEHAAVRECAVMGMLLPDRRMTLKAFVVLHDRTQGGPSMTADLQAHVKSRLLPYKYPRLVEYVDELPKTGTGKIDRQKLRAQAGGEG